jgi:hypothetical protein
VNSVDLEYYYREAVSKTEPTTITGTKYFEKVFANSFQAAYISDYGISQLYEKALYVKGLPYQTLDGKGPERLICKYILKLYIVVISLMYPLQLKRRILSTSLSTPSHSPQA